MQRFLADPDPDAPHEHPVDTRLFDKIKKEASGILAWMVRGFRDWRQNKNNIWNRKESTFGPKTFASRLKNIVGAKNLNRSGGSSHYLGLYLENDPLYKDWMGENGYGQYQDGYYDNFRCECKTCKEARAETYRY